ncbi:hypothetical protein E1B28_010674 [Marasmius oreades]|uniref:Uncharacterized protein n=1 Tax=Marasmius oreades TaxID=181124 RepID=A0A9P7URQ9_9AGAR|nr:uncharacterized protein E1B28_010674 [Marasmius oreades]KAG7091653.1 hypothetical protein E1B28_010674 [Marasmius oreades]
MSSIKAIHDKQLVPSQVATSVFRAWKHFQQMIVIQRRRKASHFFRTRFLFTRSDRKPMFPVVISLQRLVLTRLLHSTFMVATGFISLFERYLTLLLWIWAMITSPCSLFLRIPGYIYRGMRFSGHPLLKDLCNDMTYGGFELMTLASLHLRFDDIAIQALSLSCALELIFTTTHAQYFPNAKETVKRV